MFRAEWKAFALCFLEIMKTSRILLASLKFTWLSFEQHYPGEKTATQFHPQSHSSCAEQLNNIH